MTKSGLMPERKYRPWNDVDPAVLVVTCMKDEGPFILEWIAWHKSIGITDFIVFTNDCSDGTDLILNRLEDLGIVRHLPNPAIASGSTHFQPCALNYLHYMREFAGTDFVISMDVDEFINIKPGKGHFSDLLKATGPFDVLSMFELNHGSNRKISFEEGLVTELFPLHQSERPGKWKARRGVKSIVRLSDKILGIRNHRPDTTPDARWLDGSGNVDTSFIEDPTQNGGDCRGKYDLVTLDHFPLRSLESYLAKMFRGDVVVKDKMVSHRYWRSRNRNEVASSTFERQQEGFRRELDALFSDAELQRLHKLAQERHAATIARIVDLPLFVERREWIMKECW